MVSPVDPNEVRLTGDNSFMMVKTEEHGPETSNVSHWRILLSPGGPGHVLFLRSELTDNQVRIYSDNIALARWLQGEVEQGLRDFFADESTPVAEASFSRHGDVRSSCTEKVVSGDTEISMTWQDLGEPFVVRFAPGALGPKLPHGVYSVVIPAQKIQLVVKGKVAKGRPFPMEFDGHVGTNCSLGWSETWVRPR